jgi:hypothetical protein
MGQATPVVAKVEWHPYNQRATAEQWIQEGKNAVTWTRLSCHRFVANTVRLPLHALAYNLANFLRTLSLPEAVKQWSLTTRVKIGARIVRHGRSVIFRVAEVAVTRGLFWQIRHLCGAAPHAVGTMPRGWKLFPASPLIGGKLAPRCLCAPRTAHTRGPDRAPRPPPTAFGQPDRCRTSRLAPNVLPGPPIWPRIR